MREDFLYVICSLEEDLEKGNWFYLIDVGEDFCEIAGKNKVYRFIFLKEGEKLVEMGMVLEHSLADLLVLAFENLC